MTPEGDEATEVDPPEGFVVLANGAAGSVDDRALGAVVAELAQRAPTSLRLTDDQADLDDALRQLAGRRPVVVGGDGSLHLAVNRILALGLHDVPVGLVPLGTGNDLARGLGLSLDPAEAAVAAATGRVRTLPVLERLDSEEVVVNNAHLGLGQRAASLATGLKPRLGALAYPAGAAMAGVRPDVHRVEVRVDGETVLRGDVLAVVVALGPSAGGGHRLVPDAVLTEGVLHVFAMENGTLLGRLGVGATVLVRRDPSVRAGTQRWSGQTVELVHDEPGHCAWDVDGEERSWPSPVLLSVRPAAWRLVS